MSDIFDRLIKREGGYVDHPDDAGKATKFGITLDTLSRWRRSRVTTAAVKELTKREAREIYEAQYFFGPHIHLIASPRLREHILDCVVLHGPKRAIRWLQELAGAQPADGIIGPVTAAAVSAMDTRTLNNLLMRRRCRYMARRVTRKPSQAVFAAGWIRRATSFLI